MAVKYLLGIDTTGFPAEVPLSDTALLGSLGLNTVAPSDKAILEMASTSKGFLPPRMTQAQRDLMVLDSTHEGLTIYNLTTHETDTWNGLTWTTGVVVNTSVFGVTLDGSGSVVTTGQKGYVVIPYNAIITGWSIISKETGSVTFDVWKKSGGKPTVADTITASAKPALVSSDFTNSTALTGWNTSIVAGDIIGWNLDSASGSTWVALELMFRILPPVGIATLGVTLDGGGNVLTTGQKGYVIIPFDAVINGWSILSRETGSLTFDVWKKSEGKPTVTDTITGTAKPNILSGEYATSLTLTDWNRDILSGDIIGWNLDSVSASTWATLQLTITKV